MTAGTSVDPSTRRLWRTSRGPLLFGLVLVLLGLLTALVATPNRGSLDPRGADRNGSRAVAELLRAEGVDVEVVEAAAAASMAATAGSALLVANPDLLGASQREAMARTAADVVLLAPGSDALEAFAPQLDRAGEARVAVREPRCDLPAAVAAGAAEVGDRLYLAGSQAGTAVGAASVVACYPVDEAAALVQVRTGGRTVTVLGSTDPLTNARLAEQGNAALVMRLLGAHPRLVWYLPSLTDVPPEDQRSFVELVPDGWWWGAAQLVAGVLLVAVWRARRLGPVVVEPLPVVVRATETVEGRARLYRRAGARDRAAAELREAALRRLVPMLGLPRAAEPAAVIDALAARTGRSAPALGELMYGPAPDRDEALVQLATDLDAVELEVRTS